MLFNIYTNDQLRSEGTRRFIYADDLGVAAQDSDFSIVEEPLSNALSELTPYYKKNHLRTNPSKTQFCAFHLRTMKSIANWKSLGQVVHLKALIIQYILSSP